MADLFISHVAEDATESELLAQALEAEGYSVWYYERDSLPGKTYIEQIVSSIEEVRALLLFVSSATLKSAQVDREMVNGFQRSKPILPILKSLSCEEFQRERPSWDHMLGATTKLMMSGSISQILPNLLAGLKSMGIRPDANPKRKTPIAAENSQGISISHFAQEMNVTPHAVMRLARELLCIDLRTPAAVVRSGQADQLRAHFRAEKSKQEAPRPYLTVDLCEGLALELVYVPPGKFLMGSPQDEEGHNEDETQHEVTITNGFYLGRVPVTQAQYEHVMSENPSYFKGPSLPVELVSYYDASGFCEALVRRGHRTFRLPTEAEWEFACRAGTSTAFSTGLELTDEQANFDGKFSYNGKSTGVCRRQTTPVEAFPPNAFGLRDMHGNVWEWCADWYGDYPDGPVSDPKGPPTGSIKILRGGSWFHGPADARCAQRDALDPGRRHSPYGFRVVMDLA